MRNINKEDLQNILNKHKLWLLNEEGGECANLRYVNLSNVDLKHTDLRYADLTHVNLSGVDLRYADLRYANLSNVDLKHIKTNHHTLGYHLACPEKGSFIAYKKAFGYLITLLILEDAKRSSATTLKCRCDKAKVLEIKNIMSGELISKIESEHDENFIYKVGEIVEVEDFDDDRWNECSTGIHFFMNKENAINY